MFLQSVEIKNYRSLEHVKLDDLQALNILIGRNNAGKSSVFNALSLLTFAVLGQQQLTALLLSILTGQDGLRSIELRFLFKPTESERNEYIDLLVAQGYDAARRAALKHSPFLRQVEYHFKSAPGNINIALLHLRTPKVWTEDQKWAVVQHLIDSDETSNPRS